VLPHRINLSLAALNTKYKFVCPVRARAGNKRQSEICDFHPVFLSFITLASLHLHFHPLRQQHSSQNEQYHLIGSLSISTAPRFPPAILSSVRLCFATMHVAPQTQKKGGSGFGKAKMVAKRVEKIPELWRISPISHLFNPFSSPFHSICLSHHLHSTKDRGP